MESLWNGITGLDHPVIAVQDLAGAVVTFRRLGFTVSPLGSHLQWGTGNLCIMFPGGYIELRGILDTSRPLHGLDEFLESGGEGLMGVAFSTASAQESRAALERAGLSVEQYVHLVRNFHTPARTVQIEFELCFPERTHVPGLGHVVLCEHLTPALMRLPGDADHDNGAIGICSISGALPPSRNGTRALRTFFGAGHVREDDRELAIHLPDKGSIRLTDASAPQPGCREGLFGISIAVASLAQTRELLASRDVPFTERGAGSRLVVPPRLASGVEVEFSAPCT